MKKITIRMKSIAGVITLAIATTCICGCINNNTDTFYVNIISALVLALMYNTIRLK